MTIFFENMSFFGICCSSEISAPVSTSWVFGGGVQKEIGKQNATQWERNINMAFAMAQNAK